MSDNIVDEVRQMRQDVSVILMILRGNEDIGPGLLDQVREYKALVDQMITLEKERKMAARQRIRTSAMILLLVPILGWIYQSLVISDIRHLIGIDAWTAAVTGTVLQAIYVGLYVYGLRALDRFD